MFTKQKVISFFTLTLLIIAPLHLIALAKNEVRNIYLDLGAFEGDTLHMFQLNEIPTRCHPNIEWEVFAFEACPLSAHCLQLRVDHLNHLSVDSPLSYEEIPGMAQLMQAVYQNNLPFNRHLRNLFEQYESLLISRHSSRGSYEHQFLLSHDDWEAQLQTATTPRPISGTQYTAYAMGVGPKDTTLTMHWAYSNYVNGGGNLLGIEYETPTHTFAVPVLRLSRWIKASFSKDDYLYIKMDIEGMEFSLLEDLIQTGCLEYINEMDIEWHGRFNVPSKEKEKELRRILKESGIILRDHY